MRSKSIIGTLVLFIVVCMQVPSCTAAAENNSLAELFPQEKLQKILTQRSQWRPFPKAAERKAWTAIPELARRSFLDLGEESLQKEIPHLPATLYLEYKRIGNRSNFQDKWCERRKMLHCLAVAECIEGDGRFLDALADVAWAICEESSWTFPAHVGRQKAGVDLPDTSEPIVALFSAETAASLAWTVYLLENELNKVSPLICNRIQKEIDRRILTPYLQRDDFGWMAFFARSDGRRPNNWNPWINSNVLAATLLIEKDPDRRLQLTHKILRCLDNFVVPYPSDGSCDEGPSYWGRAGASVFDNLELLYSATNGRLNMYANPLIREIGRFIHRIHIADDYFVNIGDCDGRLDISRDVVFRYGRRINDSNMQALAGYRLTEEELFDSEKGLRSLGRMLHELFNLSELLAAKTPSAPMVRDVWLGHEDMQMMVARDREGSPKGLYLAAWAGHNGQSHNHNDVGNFIIYADGRPFIIDVGKPTYTRKTFSSRRYEIWAMQSAYHSLPTVNDVTQGASKRYAAKNVEYEANDKFAQLKMDIASAYPEKAGITSWRRTVSLTRGSDIKVLDSFELKQPSRNIVQNLLTPCQIIQGEPGKLILTDPKEKIRIALEYDADKLAPQIEEIELDDKRHAETWGPSLRRIRLKPKRPTKQDAWILRFSITN